MGKATQLREELLEMGVQISHVHLNKYSTKNLETLIAGIRDPNSRIGQEVKRATNESGYQGTGVILKVEGQRAQVQWDENRTWYALDKLIPV
jgi:hypothetical protein